MTNFLKHALSKNSFDQNFFEATRDLFTGWAKGNMIPYQYSHPLFPNDPVRGALLWEQFAAEHQGYYQSYEAAALIQKACLELPEVLDQKINAFVDIGPGPKKSIEIKTAKFLATLNPYVYKPADVALPYLDDAKAFVEQHYSHIKVEPTVLNIMETTSTEMMKENDLLFLDGSTLLNVPQDDETPDVLTGLVRNLGNVRRLMATDGYLAFVHDTNQNGQSLNKLYRHPVQDAFILNVLYRMARDLPLSGLDPSSFAYELEWLPEQHLVAHRAVAMKRQDVVLDDLYITISEGQKLQLTHSYKLPEAQIIDAAKRAGFRQVKSWSDGNDRMVFQLFRAVSREA